MRPWREEIRRLSRTEWLVIVAIIVILASILLPVFVR